jgi:hypothetical protein
MAVTMKDALFWDVKMCTLEEFADVSEERTASINKKRRSKERLAWFIVRS